MGSGSVIHSLEASSICYSLSVIGFVFHLFSRVRFHMYTSLFSSKFVFPICFFSFSLFTSFQSTKFVACIILFCMSTFWGILIITSDYLLALTQDEVFPYVSETLSKITLAVGTSCGLVYRTIILLGCFFICFWWHSMIMLQCNCLDRNILLGAQRQTFLFSFHQQRKTLGSYRGRGFKSNIYFFSSQAS